MKLLTTKEYAALARTSESTIRHWRAAGTGPHGTRRGKRVLYVESDVIAWLCGEDQPSGGTGGTAA